MTRSLVLLHLAKLKAIKTVHIDNNEQKTLLRPSPPLKDGDVM